MTRGLRPAASNLLVLTLSLALSGAAGSAAAQSSAAATLAQGAASAGVAAPAPKPQPLLGRADLVFGLVSAAAVAVTMHNDVWLRSEALEANTQGDRDLASALQPLGNPVLVVPALLVGYGLARYWDAPGVAAGFTEIGLSVLAAGGGALVLKEVVGRARPKDSPDDHLSFDPFSGQASFPSGHATIAFALAESINLTTGSHWAPWLTYPTAAMVGWSRVRDDEHWASDVVAGAALGMWTARKVHLVFPAGRHLVSRLELSPWTPEGAPGLCVSLR
jgi:membrane-associated phospholipid phosphatase